MFLECFIIIIPNINNIIHYSSSIVASAVWKVEMYRTHHSSKKHEYIINNKARIILLVVSERNADLETTISL